MFVTPILALVASVDWSTQVLQDVGHLGRCIDDCRLAVGSNRRRLGWQADSGRSPDVFTDLHLTYRYIYSGPMVV